MTWTWAYEKTDGSDAGRSEEFESRGDAESWIGEHHGDLVEQGVDRVRLLRDDTEVSAPMSLTVD